MKVPLEPFKEKYVSVVRARVLSQPAALKEHISRLQDVAVLNGPLIIDIIQISAAACAAVGAIERGEALTKCFATELLYRISGSNNVSDSLTAVYNSMIR